ncbi:dsDNA nuclease domain-containing protein [Streptomyces fungicidicus]|uniref:dsDNA nuclease domain-containing protein n=1 Tax=Streptomyces fungicidicus TaxID=68203 RepID=UPI0037B32DA7
MRELARMEGEDTGIKTFARYRWQAKQAVRHWLTCLKADGGPLAIVCERLEDITIVRADSIRFAQLKTRDRGSWSAKSVCDKGHGVDSLVRTSKAVREIGLHDRAVFELWLEGPMSELRETVDFFANPAAAPAAIRTKIVALGLDRSHLSDFLERMIVRVQQPSRPHIDAVILREMAALWPAQSIAELEDIYTRLLDAASAAQAGEHPIGQIRRFVARCVDASALPGVPDDMDVHVLSRAKIVALTPPLPVETDDELLARMSAGESSSMLELKMRRAGASQEVLHQAQSLRAQAEVARQLAMASRTDLGKDLEELREKVLTVARATATRAHLNGAMNPVAASRPADFISAELLSNPHILGQLDKADIFARDGIDVFGYLCQLSDECHFGWRVA